MKKFLSLLLSLLLVFSLTGCGNAPVDSKDANTGSENTPDVDASSPADEHSNALDSAPVPGPYEFPFTVDDFVSSLGDERLGEATVNHTDQYGHVENIDAYTYSLGDHASLVIYESKSSGCIAGFFLSYLADKVDSDTNYLCSFVMTFITSLFAEDYESAINQLVQDFTDTGYGSAEHNGADFTLMNDKNNIYFMVNPVE